jgi:hypothetical protein
MKKNSLFPGLVFYLLVQVTNAQNKNSPASSTTFDLIIRNAPQQMFVLVGHNQRSEQLNTD